MLSGDLPLCFQFHIHMQNSSLGNLTFLLSSLSLSFLPLLCFPPSLPLSPFHLIPSCSQFAFSILKRFEANTSHKTPPPPPFPLRDWTLGLLTFFSPLYSIFLLTVSSILYPPPPNLVLPIFHHFFFYSLYCSCLKNCFLDQSEVNLLWPGIPCWASPSFTLSLFVHRHQAVTWYRWNIE